MTLKHSFARAATGAAVAAAALLLVALAPGLGATAHAQQAPYTAYGTGLQAGQVVAVYDGSTECGSVTVDANGDWLIRIASDAPCSPQTGDTLTFMLDGQATTASGETWRPGGAPANVAQGIALVVKQMTSTGPGTFGGAIGDHGINPAVYNGGTVAQAVAAAGHGLQSMWIYVNGQAVGYTVGAPDFVNSGFLGLFPHDTIPAGQIMILVKS